LSCARDTLRSATAIVAVGNYGGIYDIALLWPVAGSSFDHPDLLAGPGGPQQAYFPGNQNKVVDYMTGAVLFQVPDSGVPAARVGGRIAYAEPQSGRMQLSHC
jgi:hypothetical protein